MWRSEDLGHNFDYPITMLEDNKAAVSFQQSTTPHSKLKGIYNFRDMWVRELKDLKYIKAKKVPTEENVADMFTKCLQWRVMKKLLAIINCDSEPIFDLGGTEESKSKYRLSPLINTQVGSRQ